VLRRFPEDTLHLRIRLEQTPEDWAARGVLSVPHGTVVGRGRGETLETALDALADSLFRDARRYKERRHADAAAGRKRRLRRTLESSVEHLGAFRGEDDREAFFDVLRPALAALRERAEHEVRIAALEGHPGESSRPVDEVLDEVLVRAWDRWEERPDGVPLERWLTALLHEVVDEGTGGVETESLDAPAGSADGRPRTDWDAERALWFLPGDESPALEDLIPDAAAPPTAWAEAADEAEWILEHLADLPRAQRRAYLLHALEGWDVDEIALLQGRDVEAVQRDIESTRELLAERAGGLAHRGENA